MCIRAMLRRIIVNTHPNRLGGRMDLHGVERKLFDMIAENGSIRCPKRFFAEQLGISEMTVFRHLRDLESKGLIASYGSGGAIRTYEAVDCAAVFEIDELKAEICALKAEIAELKSILGTVTDHNTTVTDHNNPFICTRMRVNNNKNIYGLSKTNNQETIGKTETEGARGDRNIGNEPRTMAETAFDEIWDTVDWLQKARYRQTKDVQWGYAKKTLDTILDSVPKDTLMERIRLLAGDRMAFGKTVSYWLKDNADALMACETGKFDWSKI